MEVYLSASMFITTVSADMTPNVTSAKKEVRVTPSPSVTVWVKEEQPAAPEVSVKVVASTVNEVVVLPTRTSHGA